ncbi:MAG: dihydrofolate reductase [Betaproteobacteria bacterium]|nr:dihydrofolate reductase [Betaproteobacteria bacterium]
MPDDRKPRLSLIAAVAANGVIGADNALPWRLPEDLKRFKALTLGHPVIMGRKTFESIGRPLPGRRNLVVTRNAGYRVDGCEVLGSLEAALDACAGSSDEVFVIGGAQIYAEALPLAQRIYLTELHRDFMGDARFPDFARTAWKETSREKRCGEDGLPYDFAVYERI